MTSRGRIGVLIVDDSAVVRKILSDTLAGDPGIEVLGTAPDPYVAREKLLALEPDVLTLDIEMPRMDGLTFLRHLMRHRPMPVIVISSLGQASCGAAIEALRLGAVEVLAKPAGPYSVGDLRLALAAKVRAAAAAVVGAASAHAPSPPPPPAPRRTPPGGLIVIGASTGGTEAIRALLASFPADCPPTLVAQHIPAGFSRAFAQHLDRECAMEVKEAEDGDRVEAGRVLVAPGNFHLLLARAGGLRVAVKDGPRVCYQRPSVDVLFESVAREKVPRTIGVLLTGMGSDGARGLLSLRRQGAFTIAQDERSCVVFGMPREAIRLGAAACVAPLNRMAGTIFDALEAKTAHP